MPPGSDPYTGLSDSAAEELTKMWKPDVHDREAVLRNTLINGPSWETSTVAIIAALSKKIPPKEELHKEEGGVQSS